ncbi:MULTISPECIES: VOC family protein [unclassified Pseudofrankia]|uniref:VOC family protein n=1 Tax=unclassified Pseudofrankia TaxID=2994372 RepID=UPI0008DA91B0|nr:MULTISPECIES: VOC family protein [unclassified Pseudofrankia]MDT3440713.1 VOC family protein [Pseudofrankia sp. BMG5.37]OHV58916.1 glyoxalase [Pseudofrankia sp. BMG5.36]
MALSWKWLVVDCADPAPVASFWADVFGVSAESDQDGEWIVVSPDSSVKLLFGLVPEAKTVKNRLHLDLTPSSPDEQRAEVERLLALGATRADVGQTGEESWVVLADPAGNEFCILSGKG